MGDNITVQIVEFSEELYQKNMKENNFVEEYEGGNLDADN